MINVCPIPTEACEANVIMGCVNKTTCAKTYGDVYNALATQENHFNISQALYPAKKPSSVLVHITLYGANGTENCSSAAYTWSMSCLYAAFPGKVLAVLSLGSIVVPSRTEELSIRIPPFCCNVSTDNRKEIIIRVLAALQDLAVSPGVQDPRLNTAECVIEGHKPNITATERSAYIRAMLWFSLIFTIFFGPLLALITLIFFNEAEINTDKKKIRAMAKAVKWNSWFLLAVEIGLSIAVVALSACGHAPWDIYLIVGIINVGGLVSGAVITCFDFLPEGNCCKRKLSLLQLGIFWCANVTVYHFCWLVIGVMINALWGVTVLLFVCVVIGASVFITYNYCYEPSDTFDWKTAFILCAAGLLSVWALVVVVILAGQSFFGRETADDVVKTVTLYVTTAFISWILSMMKGDD